MSFGTKRFACLVVVHVICFFAPHWTQDTHLLEGLVWNHTYEMRGLELYPGGEWRKYSKEVYSYLWLSFCVEHSVA